MQSPIHIEHAEGAPEEIIGFHYAPAPLHILNTGHTVQVDLKPGSFMTIGEVQYDLQQFHFHVPSEHLVRNQTFAMEAHLVHQNSAGEIAVIGVLYNCGQPDPLIKSVWEYLPPGPGEEHTQPDTVIDPMQLIPAESPYFSYTGSLTTPPYTEGVMWMLFRTPLTVSTSQLEQFTTLFGQNARPVQSLLGRRVLEGTL